MVWFGAWVELYVSRRIWSIRSDFERKYYMLISDVKLKTVANVDMLRVWAALG